MRITLKPIFAAVALVVAASCAPQGEPFSAKITTLDATGITADGAILNASYSGFSTKVPAKDVCFVYGLSKDKLYGKVPCMSIGSHGKLTAFIDGLDNGTTYWFTAVAMVWDQEKGDYVLVEGEILSFTTEQTIISAPDRPMVSTLAATGITAHEAKLNASFSNISTTYPPQDLVFKWGTSSSDLSNTTGNFSDNGDSGSFSVVLVNLQPGTTYWYKASMSVWDDESGRYITIEGRVLSFRTQDVSGPPSATNLPAWYELPVVDASYNGNYITDAGNPDLYYAFHWCDGGEKGPGGRTARNYTVCYSARHHCTLWVAAPRHSMYVGGSGRTEAYGPDPNIPTSVQYSSKSTGGGCNKGHMLGSAERTSSRGTNAQVFYYSNIAPQLSNGFNTGGGGWNTLEDWVDGKVCSDTLYVVIGCHFEKYTDGHGITVEPATISFGGRNDVTRPTMFYYVLLRTKKGNSGKALKDCSSTELQCAAFVRSHTNSLKGVKISKDDIMSVSDLEKVTGLSYFSNLPQAPKSTFNASDWGL